MLAVWRWVVRIDLADGTHPDASRSLRVMVLYVQKHSRREPGYWPLAEEPASSGNISQGPQLSAGQDSASFTSSSAEPSLLCHPVEQGKARASHVRLSDAMTVAHQALCPWDFQCKKYWRGWHFLDLRNPGIKPIPCIPALAG